MVSAKTPTIANIKNNVSLADARALLSIAICEACDFFNVGKNMNDTQIALTVDLIIERFWYFKLEEIKYCFRRAMMRARLFDRLDGNIIIGWLREYDTERTEEAIKLSQNESAEAENRISSSEGGMDFASYLENLKERAKTDEGAAKLLDSIKEMEKSKMRFTTNEERQQNEKDFKMWRTFKYLMGNKD